MCVSVGLDVLDPSSPPVGRPLSEFTSGAACRLYTTCVEVLSLSCDAMTVSKGIISVVVSQ